MEHRVDALRLRVAGAAERAGRDPSSIRIVGAAKFQTLETIRAAVACGVEEIGENYAQELRRKADLLGDLPIRWHMIGSLQRNKAGMVAHVGATVHTVTSVALAQALARHAQGCGRVLSVLVQVQAVEGSERHGVALLHLPQLLEKMHHLEGLEVQGLMVLPPADSDAALVRSVFRRVAAAARTLLDGSQELSMGMSGDLELAIEEGATMVRVGTALFGPRPAVVNVGSTTR